MKFLLSIFLALIGFNILICSSFFTIVNNEPQLDLYFLDVGQGDSALIKLPGRNGGIMKMMIDGGPGKQTLASLYNALPPTDRYIDVLILTHPQLDHFGGFIDILKRFEVGVFIHNGREGTSAGWDELKSILKEKNIRTVVLKEGDSIQYGDNHMKFLSPNDKFIKSKQLNDTPLVVVLESEESKTLFTADIGFK